MSRFGLDRPVDVQAATAVVAGDGRASVPDLDEAAHAIDVADPEAAQLGGPHAGEHQEPDRPAVVRAGVLNEDGSTRSSAASKPRSMISTGRPPQPGSAGNKPPASTPPPPETRSASDGLSESPGDASNSLNNRSGPPHAVGRRATGNQPTVTSSSPSRRRRRMRSQGCSDPRPPRSGPA